MLFYFAYHGQLVKLSSSWFWPLDFIEEVLALSIFLLRCLSLYYLFAVIYVFRDPHIFWILMLLVIRCYKSWRSFSPPPTSPPLPFSSFFGKIQVLLRKYLYLWHILGLLPTSPLQSEKPQACTCCFRREAVLVLCFLGALRWIKAMNSDDSNGQGCHGLHVLTPLL